MTTNEAHTIRIDSYAPSVEQTHYQEAARKIFLDSLDHTREYCEKMITLSSGATPVYISILGVWTEDWDVINVLFAAPILAFLAATVAFSYGLSPQKYDLNLENTLRIAHVRSQILRHRGDWGIVGLALFCLGNVLAVACLFMTAKS